MIPITFQAVTAYLLDDMPQWANAIELRAFLPLHVEAGVTAREARTPTGDTPRLALHYAAVLSSDGVTTTRNSLQALSTERVLCPLWPALFAAGDSPVVEADYYILLDDSGAAPEIKPHADLPFAREAYPLLVGYLEDPPDPTLITDDVEVVDFRFTEGDEWHITAPAFAPPAGLTTPAGSRPLFPWRPNWATRPRGPSLERDIDRQEIGEGRSPASGYYEQPGRRECRQNFTLQDDEPWELLAFFQDLGGAVDSFWLPAGMSDATILPGADVGSSDTEIAIVDSAKLGTNRFLLFDDGTTRAPVQVDSIDDIGHILLLAAEVGAGFVAADTRLESLMLARFKSDELVIRFSRPGLAAAAIAFREVPWETAAVAGETAGTTIGAVAKKAYLYALTIPYPGAAQVSRYTSFERDLTYGGNTYAAAHFTHGDIQETDTLDRHQTTIESRMFTGNPLAQLFPFFLEWPLSIEIYEVDVDGSAATNVTRVFRGEIDAAPTIRPPFIEATASSYGALLDRRLPRQLFQPTCNWSLFEADCSMALVDWTFTADVVAFTAGTLELEVENLAGPELNPPADYFAGGYLVIGTGSSAQYRMIAASTAEAGGALSLFVATPFATAPAAAAEVTFYPGCDGRYETCRDKFDNVTNFGGFRFMPIGNPVLAKVTNQSSPGGKK